jgi:hypothetical protein
MMLEECLPLTINCDWQRICKIYDKLIDNYNREFYTDSAWIPNAQYTAHDLGHHGRLMVEEALTNDTWFIWTGRLLESMIPWSQNLRQSTHAAGIFLENFCFFRHYGDIFPHIDSKDGPDTIYQTSQCNLNFIILAHDETSTTCFEHPDGIHYYIGQQNRAYLLDSGVRHWVTNTKKREVFQIKFHSDYATVKKFFQRTPMVLA